LVSIWRIRKIKGNYYLYHGDEYVGNVELIVKEWRRGRDSNPRVDTHTGSPDRVTVKSVESELMSYPLELLKYLKNLESLRGAVRITVEGNKVSVEFNSVEDVTKFISFLQSLGVTNVEKREVRVEYDEKFWDYLVKDRQLDTRTARDYMNYLKKLNGKTINYNLYLEIVGNKWKVKLVRIFLDYLFKTGKITWEEKEKLKSIFKVKKNNSNAGLNEYKVDVDGLIERTITMRAGLYKLILELLLYSGLRLSEAVRLLREWSEERLECFGDICRYRMGWVRGRKRCDYVFFPKKLLPKILKHVHRIGQYKTVRKDIYDEYGIKAKDFRKLHYRLCRNVLEKEVCAFFQSRTANLDVSDRHYDELLSKSTERYPRLVEKIDELINRIKDAMADGIPVTELEVEGFIDEIDEVVEDGEERILWEFRLSD